MKKILFALTAILVIALSGCGQAKDAAAPAVIKKEAPPMGITTNAVDYTVISDLATLPKEVQDKLEALKEKRGYIYIKDGDRYIFTIFAGQKPTPGYGIVVKSVEDVEGITSIVVEETTPKEGLMVAQVITYPYVTISLPMVHERIRVVNINNEEFDAIK